MKEIKLPDYMYIASPLHVAQTLGQVPREKELETNNKIAYLLIGTLITVSLFGIGYLVYDTYRSRKKKINR